MNTRNAAAIIAASLILATPASANCWDHSGFRWMTGGVIASTLIDGEKTMRVIDKGGREANPIAAPFIAHGRVGMYAFGAVVGGAALGISCWLLNNDNPAWPILPGAVISGHMIGFTLSMVL